MSFDTERVTWWQRGIAGAALLNAGFATWLLTATTPFIPVYVAALALTFITAVPLFSADRPTFAATTLTCAIVLTVLSIPLVFFGAHLYLPGTALLLAARFATRARLPHHYQRMTLALLLAVVITPWTVTIWNDLYRVPNLYVVDLPPGTSTSSDIYLYDGSGIGYGATDVRISPGQTADTVYVYYRTGLSPAAHTRLDHRLHELMPTATRIERCHHHTC